MYGSPPPNRRTRIIFKVGTKQQWTGVYILLKISTPHYQKNIYYLEDIYMISRSANFCGYRWIEELNDFQWK